MSERWIEFTVNVTLKHNLDSFGIKYDRLGEFRFCAQSAEDATAIAGSFTKGATHSIDTQKSVEIVGCVPVQWEEVELARCRSGKHHPDMTMGDLKAWTEELEWSLAQ